MDTAPAFDPAKLDVGNIMYLEHVNLRIPDQRPATAFYLMGLGLTRDPYMRVGLDNFGVNVGRGQIHMPKCGAARRGEITPTNVLRGTIGLVLPDLGRVARNLETVGPWLEGTKFSYKVHPAFIEATCPWGNRFRCHAPSPEFGDTDLAIAYIEFDVPRGTAPAIARFYREALLAPAGVEERGGDAVARVDVGICQALMFHETDAPIPPYDGHHFQIYVANYSGPHRFLKERGLVTEVGEQWAFTDIIDLDTGKVLFQVEHEMRCMKHSCYNRPLVNRNPAQTANNRERGHDAFRGSY